MKTHIFPILTSTAALAMVSPVYAQDATEPAGAPAEAVQAPAEEAAVETSAEKAPLFTEESAAAYLQEEREILDLLTFDNHKQATRNSPRIKKLVKAFRQKYPKPLAAAVPADAPCPAWLLAALKEEHNMLLELLEISQNADRRAQARYPEMTRAAQALYEPMLLAHAALQLLEGRLFQAYTAAPTLENARAIMEGGLTYTDSDSYFYRAGFLYGIFTMHPDHVAELLDAVHVDSSQTAADAVVGEALWLLNTDEALAARMIWQGFVTPAEGATPMDFHHLENLHNNVEEAQLLDCAWGVYDATKDPEILRSFVLCAARETPPADGYRFWALNAQTDRRDPVPAELGDVIALSARWSVRSKAKKDPAFAAQVDAILETLTPEQRERYNAPLPEGSDTEYFQN